MPRTRKSSSSQENIESQDLTSKNTRRKRTPSAEMAGMNRSGRGASSAKRSVGRPRKSASQMNPEYESPEKTRSYESHLTDDYYQEGARYEAGPVERGITEFEYDRRHRSQQDPYYGAPQNYNRGDYGRYDYDREYGNRDITSDYRNARKRHDDYRSEYMSGHGDVPAGGYYGYRRMQERYGSPYGSAGRESEYDWDRRSDQPYYGSSRYEDRYYGSQGRPAYGGAWHSDYDAPSYDDERSYRRQSDEYGYDMSRGNQRGYDRYEERTRNERDDRDSWQDWSQHERNMMNRRRGGYPKNLGY